MKSKLLMIIWGVFISTLSLQAQTTVLSEDFETLPLDLNSSGTSNWARSTTLAAGGTYSDTAAVTLSGNTYLTTNAFSTLGNYMVKLEFDQICKIEYFDGGFVEYSLDGGTSWIIITSTYYLGSGTMTGGNKFTANSYVTAWVASDMDTIPNNTWWKHETFDIGTLVGNQASVMLRFRLSDLNLTGANMNYGWALDNVLITMALSESTPPSITQLPTIWQDTLYQTGPFEVKAKINDLSGIDTAYVVYTINGGANNYVGMNMLNVDTFAATIPAQAYNTRIDYFIVAVDGSIAANADSSAAKWFYTKKAPAVVTIGTGTSTTYYIPFYGLYDYGWSAALYAADEIGNAGFIDSLFFYVGNTVASYTINNQHLMLACVPYTDFPDGAIPDSASMTMFYSGTVTWVGAGWFKFTAATPFYYNGTDNLLIHYRNRSGAAPSGYPNFQYTSTTPIYRAKYVYSNTYSSVFPSVTGTRTYNRPNLKIAFALSTTVHDVAAVEIAEPLSVPDPVVGTPYDMKVKIKNIGSDTLTSVTLNWELDGILQTPFVWNGTLLQDEISADITIGSVTFPAAGNHVIRFWTSLPDGFADEMTLNDTVSQSYFTCSAPLAGTYTIGAAGDFTTISEAADILNHCGISGPVVFNIASGTYNEQISLSAIPGASAVNTVTFQSATGNYSDVTISGGGDGTTNNYVVNLDGTDFVRIKNITMQASGAVAGYTTVLYYTNGATNNIFQNNRFVGIENASSTSANNAVIYSPTGTTSVDTNNVFTGNLVEFGSYGMYVNGGSATALESGTVISKNQVINAGYRGIYAYYQNAPVLDSNVVVSHATSSTSFYGLYAGYCDNAVRIRNNTITLKNSGYGLYVSYCDAVAGSEGLIANNMVSVDGTGTSYGIYHTTSGYKNYYFNSVNVTSNSTTARAFYSTGSTTGNNLINNIFAYTGSNASGMAIYISTTAGITSMNYNDLYSTGTNLGYWSSNRLNLAAWQTATAMDANSVSVNPGFFSATNLHTSSPALFAKGTPLAAVTDDIDNDVRAATPCIGADEFIMYNKNIAINNILAPNNGCALSTAETVTIRVSNAGIDNITSFDAYYVLNNGTPVHEVVTATILPLATYDYSFTTKADLSAYGNYSIDAYVTQTGEQVTMNDTIKDYTFYSGWDFSNGAYKMGFEPTEYFADWSIFNSDGHATYKWVMPYSGSSYSHTGTYSAQFYNGTTNAGEDWLFSRCFPFETGKTYEVSFWYRVNTATSPQTLTLKMGSAPASASMTTTLKYLPTITNVTHQQSVTRFTVPTSGSYYFGWLGLVGLTSYAYIDDINIREVPVQEAAVIDIIAPVTSCGLSNAETVTLQIQNTGADTISGNLTAYFQANNGSIISEAIATEILPGDTLDYSFAATLDMFAATHDSTFNIVSWITLVADTVSENDTTAASVESGYVPSDPVVTNDTIPYGTSTVLTALSTDSIVWYGDMSTHSYFHIGETFTTPLLTDTTTYYVEASTGWPDIKITEAMLYNYSSGGATSPMPSWINGDDQVEITNLGSARIDLSGYKLVLYGVGARTYTLPAITLVPAEIAIIHIGTGTDDPAHNFYNTGGTNDPLSSSSLVGFVLKNPMDSVIDAVASNGYAFDQPTSGVTTSDWSGSVPSSSSKAGIIRTVSDNNVAADWVVSASGGPIQTLGAMNPGLSAAGTGSSLGCHSNRVPVTVVVLPPAAAFEMAEIISPVTGCTEGIDSVKIKFYNSGADTLDIPFNVNYQVNNTTPVTETVNYIMLPGDSMIHTFLTPISLPITSGDTSFALTVWGELAVDFYTINDTLHTNVTRGYIPPVPVTTGVSVPYGSTATLNATSTYLINWFEAQYGGNLLETGTTYTTPVLYTNQTYYVESQEGAIYNYTFDTDLQGWSALTPCSSYTTYNWAWDSDGGAGAAWMVDPATYSAAILKSPVLNATGNYAELSFRHRFFTENGYDNGYVAYRQDGGAWTHLSLTSGDYNANDYLGKDPLLGSCSTGPTFGVFTGLDSNYHVSTAQIPLTGASDFEIAFVFSSDVSTGKDGWYIDNVDINMTGCSSDRIPVAAVVTGQPDVDAGVLAVQNPVGEIPLGTENIEVEIINYGINTLTSANIAWTVNGVAQTPYAWTGSLLTGEKDTVVIGSYAFGYTPYPGLNDLVVWTENPNAVADTFNANDTVAVVIDAHEPYNGTYYIQTAAPDFDSFTTAALALNDWGIDGPVTILAANGTYAESFVLTPVPGASATNTVEFSSVSGINTDVVIEFANTSTQNYVLKLDSADYITFSDMSMRSTSAATYGRVIELSNGASYNRFENLILTGIDGSSNSSAVIYSGSTGTETGNVFTGNVIDQGYYSVYFYGSSTNHKRANYFVDNTITNFEYYGIYLYYNDSARVIGNNLSNIATASTNYHLYLYYVAEGSRIENNTIVGSGSGTFYGIYLYYNNSTGTNPNLVANNFVSQIGNSMGTAYGIYSYYSNYLNIYNNSVNISAGSATDGRAFYQNYGTGNVNVVNNNFANTSGGYAFYVSSAAVINTTDYNNLYTNGPSLAYWGGAARTTLTALQAVSLKDQHSKSINPGFYSPSNLHTYQFILSNGTPLTEVTTDIDGDIRSAVNPTIGADEFIPQNLDAGIIKFDEPTTVNTAGPNPVSVTLGNFGNNTITSANIAWSINDVPQTTYAWSGSLAFANEEDSVLLGTPVMPWGVNHLKAWSELPNGTTDMLVYNDTAWKTIISCDGGMKGTYSIGATGDFADFAEAVLYATSCGIDSVVVFEVQNGVYAETVNIPALPGASATNTVTFISESGNAADVVLQPTLLPADYAVVRFDHTSDVAWKNMTIDATTQTYARGFVLDNINSNITIDGNVINLPNVSSSSTSVVGVYDGDFTDTNIVVTNNIINDGAVSVYFYGDGSTSLQPGTIISNNTMNSYSYRGIVAYYHLAPVISGNYIYMDNNAYTTVSGMYLSYCDDGLQLTNNKINIEVPVDGYGIYLSSSDGLATAHGLIANNFIAFKGDGSTTSSVIYSSSNTYLDIVYNSVNLYDTDPDSRAIYVTSGSSNTLKNNILAATGGAMAAYFSSTTSITESDYNNLYTSGSVLGYYSGSKADLAAWQTASSKDANSISSDPLFISNSDLHVYLATMNAAATPIAGITTDIDGEVRNATTPDIGADEFTPLNVNIGVTNILKPVNDFCATTDQDTVKIRIFNFGATTANSFTVGYKLNGTVVSSQTWTGTLLMGTAVDYEFATLFTPQAGWNNLEAFVSIAGDGDLTNDTAAFIYKGIPEVSVPYADDFETNDYWGANIVNNGWEFGVPAGTVIDSAYSPDLAWKTNLDGTHDNNQTLVLYSPVFSFIHAYNAQLSFWHWIDTDAGDGGYVQYTSNGGTTWNNLGVQNDPTGTNWAPDAVNTAYGWSGHSGGWVQSSIDLSFLNFNPFETQFRFIFYSNAVGTNGDGWAIDNFEIVIPQADIDAGVIEIVSPAGTLTPGVQETITVKITNYGTNTLTSIPVVASVNTGQPPISATWTGSLASGDTTTFTFPGSYTPVNVSDFEFCAYTDISNDYIAYNDTTCVTLYTNVGLGENNVSALSLNPNPADDFTALEFEAATSDNAVLTITSAEGKLIRETVISINAGTNNYTIETADLAPGLYHWTLRSNSSNGEGKLIINR